MTCMFTQIKDKIVYDPCNASAKTKLQVELCDFIVGNILPPFFVFFRR